MKKQQAEGSVESEGVGDETSNDDLYYYSKQEKAYKVFDPRSKKWSVSVDGKPSAERVA